MKEKITSADCLKCGCCCLPPQEQDVFCNVTEEDEKRLGKKFARRLVKYPSVLDMAASAMGVQDSFGKEHGAIKTKDLKFTKGPFKEFSTCACAALTGNILHRVKCSIYKVRPECCHSAVKPGDKACRIIRAHFHRTAKEEKV